MTVRFTKTYPLKEEDVTQIQRAAVMVTEEALIKMLPARLSAQEILSVQHHPERGVVSIVFRVAANGRKDMHEGAQCYTHPAVTSEEIDKMNTIALVDKL